MAATRKKIIYRNSVYDVHQVGPKNAGSQNSSFSTFEEAVDVTQICLQRRVADGNLFFSQIMFLRICNNFFKYFSTLNQYSGKS
jgi:hypothetical protein